VEKASQPALRVPPPSGRVSIEGFAEETLTSAYDGAFQFPSAVLLSQLKKIERVFVADRQLGLMARWFGQGLFEIGPAQSNSQAPSPADGKMVKALVVAHDSPLAVNRFAGTFLSREPLPQDHGVAPCRQPNRHLDSPSGRRWSSR
jgi:hypothetical protein